MSTQNRKWCPKGLDHKFDTMTKMDTTIFLQVKFYQRGDISSRNFIARNFVEHHFPEKNHLGGQKDDFWSKNP